MSPDRHPGYPNDGAHYISTPNYDNVGYQKVQGKDNKEVDNIVVRGMTTSFHFKWLHDNPITYEISLGSRGGGNWVREDSNRWVNVKDGQYQQWILNEDANDGTYNIVLEGSNLAWTDMGPDKQIELRYYNNQTNQRFRISK